MPWTKFMCNLRKFLPYPFSYLPVSVCSNYSVCNQRLINLVNIAAVSSIQMKLILCHYLLEEWQRQQYFCNWRLQGICTILYTFTWWIETGISQNNFISILRLFSCLLNIYSIVFVYCRHDHWTMNFIIGCLIYKGEARIICYFLYVWKCLTWKCEKCNVLYKESAFLLR